VDVPNIQGTAAFGNEYKISLFRICRRKLIPE
jgi:hypothetical protein